MKKIYANILFYLPLLLQVQFFLEIPYSIPYFSDNFLVYPTFVTECTDIFFPLDRL